MKFTKGLFILLLILLLTFSLVSATKVIVTPVNETSNHIFFDETAHFTVKIVNSLDTDQVYSWNLDPVKWIIDTPATGRVEANSEKTFDMVVRPHPVNFRGPGYYVVPLSVRSSPENEIYGSQINMYMQSINERLFAYIPSVALGASLAEKIDPRKTVSVQVQIRNRNILEIEDIALVIDGEHFQTTKHFPLSGLEEKTLEFRFNVDALLKPTTSKMRVKLIYENKTISEFEKYYDVQAYTSVERDSMESAFLFKNTQVSTLTNDGNVIKEVNTDLDIKWYKWIFTSIDISADNLEKVNGNSWTITLQPREVATVTLVENYRVLPIIALLIIFLFVVYYLMRSPIVLHKQTIVTGGEDGVSDMKVRVFIKNRTNKSFYNVRVLDRVPSIASVAVPKGLGVLEPSKIIITQKKGTILKWDFETLEAYEERIVTYNLKAKLKIIGYLGLPSVRIKYETVGGQQRTTESGKASIGTK